MTLQLICINYGNFEDALKATRYCLDLFPKFQLATVIHPECTCDHELYDDLKGRFDVDVQFRHAQSPTQNECFTFELPQYITCDHAIGIQWDGFIIRPDLWNPDWLQYDWMAPPWPLQNIPNPEWRVGSGGFCMFSKRMSELWPKFLDTKSYNDWQIGATKRHLFEECGMKYAPVEVAEKFGREIPIEDSTVEEGESFGMHGFQYHAERERYRRQVYGSRMSHIAKEYALKDPWIKITEK